jgi:hypothetical protein
MFHFLDVSPWLEKRQRGDDYVVSDSATVEYDAVCANNDVVAYRDFTREFPLVFRHEFVGAVSVNVNA